MIKTITTKNDMKNSVGILIFLGLIFITTTSYLCFGEETSRKESAPIFNDGKSLQMGTYLIYSGIPSTYIGKLVLMKDNSYKVSLIPNDDLFDTGGTFLYQPEDKTILWKSGLCKINKWNGNLVNKNREKDRIVFNKATYAEFSHE